MSDLHTRNRQAPDERTVPSRSRSERAEARRHIREYINRVSLKRTKQARYPHPCCLCDCPIPTGEFYRDGGFGQRSHEFCFDAVAKASAWTEPGD